MAEIGTGANRLHRSRIVGIAKGCSEQFLNEPGARAATGRCLGVGPYAIESVEAFGCDRAGDRETFPTHRERRCRAEADRDRLTITLGDVLVAEKGMVAASYAEADGAAYMKRQELVVGVDLGLGSGQATVWTCDLTHRYIDINADYRS